MTNLDKLKEKINKLSAKEMAGYMNDLYLDDACEMCVYDKNKCIEDCEWGIEKYLKKEDGARGIKKEPYCTVEFPTKEDYEKLQETLGKQTPKKPREVVDEEGWEDWACPECRVLIEGGSVMLHCWNCGQKLDWRKKNE